MRRSVPQPRTCWREAGQALLAVLAIMLAISVSSASFIWFMNQQQTRAGRRYHTLAARYAAEAGVHRVLAVLESDTFEGAPGRAWRPRDHTEPVQAGPLGGRFTVSVEMDPGGALIVTSEGEVGDTRRVVRARVHLISAALLAAVYAAGSVELERAEGATAVIPYGLAGRDFPWIHIVIGGELWLGSAQVALNAATDPLDLLPGPVDPPEAGPRAAPLPLPSPLTVMAAHGAQITLGEARRRVDPEQLRVAGIPLAGVVVVERLPLLPMVNQVYYRELAGANILNAAINAAAGRLAGDGDLERKPDSLYTRDEAARVVAYLAEQDDPPALRGVIYVRGGVTVPAGARVRIADGALVAESTVQVDPDASLAVLHTPAARTLPGILVLGNGAVVVGPGARLHVHGLVFVSRILDTGAGALVDIVGALASGDRSTSVRNGGAVIVVRYDPAILGTPGLLLPDEEPAIAWLSALEEVPP